MAQTAITYFERPHGRRIALHRLVEGDSGKTIVICHAAPGSAAFDPDPEQTWRRGVTLLAVDRPGYGQSDPVVAGEWSTVGAAADDLAAALDRLELCGVGVAGWSAGGRVALALAARRPDLVERAVVLATPAPHEQVPWVPAEQQATLEHLRGQPPEQVHAALMAMLAPMVPEDLSASGVLQALGASPADEQALAMPRARERLAGMLAGAFAQGAAGMAYDIAGYALQPWGFEPAEARAKTLLLYGSADPIAGSRHGSWWQKRLPSARIEVVPGAGHLLVMPMWGRALSHLAPHTQRS
jgi:pimeloyl-ACP methyl ester carboxylesterase